MTMTAKNRNFEKYASGLENLKLVEIDPNSPKLLGMARRPPPCVHC
jgi:hypothetical protein